MALGTPTDGGAAYSATGGGGTTVTPAYPASIAAGDCLVLIVGQKPSTANGGTVTTPSGWTLRESLTGAGGYGTTLAADTGNTNLFIYTKDTVAGTETGNLTVTVGDNNICWGIIVRIPAGGGILTYGTADGSRTTAPTSGTAFTTLLTNGATAPNLQNGDMAIWAMCIPTDVLNNGFTAPTISSTGTTFGTPVELEEPDSGGGNDIGGYVAYAAATAGSSTAAPTVGVTATGTVTNVRGPIALIRVRETPELKPGLYTNTNTFYTPTVTASNELTPARYDNTNTFYSPTVEQLTVLLPDLYTNTNTFYSATVTSSYTLTPDLYTNTNTFYTPTVVASNTLTPDLYTNTNTFYSATVASVLAPDRYDNTNTFYTQTLTASNTLTPDLYTNTNTFYALNIVQVISPDLYTNTNTFYSAAVAAVLTPDFYTNTNTFYAHTASASNELTPDLYTNTNTFYSPIVSEIQVLAPPLVVNDNTFYTQNATNTNTLTPALFTNTNAFYSPIITRVLVQGIFRSAVDNYIPNSSTTGADAALDRLPNQWYSESSDPNFLTYTLAVDSVEVTTGIPTITGTINFTNTATSGNYYVEILFAPYTAILPTRETNTTNTATVYARKPDSLARRIFIRQYNSSGGIITTTAQAVTGSTFTRINVSLNAASVNANTQTLQQGLGLLAPNNTSGSFTFIIGGPQLEYRVLGDALSPFYQTTGYPSRLDSNVVYYPEAERFLQPALYTNTNTFYAAAVVNVLEPDLYTNTNTVYAQTVTASNDVLPDLYTNNNTFYAADAAASNDLLPALYTNTNTFYTPTVLGGDQFLDPDLYTNTNTFYDPTVSTSNEILPDLFTNANTFYAQTATNINDVLPDLYANTNVFYTPEVIGDLQPPLVVNQNLFYSPTLTASYDLLPSLYVNPNTFYAPTALSVYELRCEDYVDPGYVLPGYVNWSAFNQNVFYGITLTNNITVPIAGVVGYGYVGGVNVWGIVIDTQTPTWDDVTTPQTPGWALVTDTQSPGWSTIGDSQTLNWQNVPDTQSPGWVSIPN